MLTMGVLARRALCTLASPLASPGPRCRRVEAGLSAMRAYPSAAPVATPSNSPSTHRISPTRSSAATKCISEVPGLAKPISTPAPANVSTKLSAPFICSFLAYAEIREDHPRRGPHQGAQGSDIHEWAQSPSGDKVIIGAAGPCKAPVLGANHHGEVEGNYHVV